ncbi:MAG TPA: archaetidylserine decarboxylase, partial [Myxococcota bacterium]|nr:archaetidylserine decarboxylase [Myxococcota bacterium]
MRDVLIVSALSLVPRRAAARCMGVMARTGLSRLGASAFVRAYGVDLSEAAEADFPTLEALFTRRLRPGARPVDPSPEALVSPVDGVAAWVGTSRDGRFELLLGQVHDLAALLGAPCDGEREVAVLYLSPRDYHRVHAPYDGRVTRWRYVPGTLWPVFPAAVRRVRGLFARNERVVGRLAGADLELDVVLVGAFGVGRIEVGWADLLTNTGAGAREGEVDWPVGRGGELGVFHLGSTVIVVAPAGRVAWTV